MMESGIVGARPPHGHATYTVAVAFGMVDPLRLLAWPVWPALLAIYLGLLGWMWHHFRHLFAPLPQRQPDAQQSLQGFSNSYWAFFLLYVLILPTRHTGLARIHVSMRTKILLIGAYMPLLMTTVLLRYYWWRTGYLPMELWLAWLALGLAAFVMNLRPRRRGHHRHRQQRAHRDPQPGRRASVRLSRRGRPRPGHRLAAARSRSAETAARRPSGRGRTGRPPQCRHGPADVPARQQHAALPMSLRASSMQMDGHTYYTLLVADISERKATEQMLLEAEARYRDLVETAHDLVWSMDAEGRWTYLNDAAERIYGYSPAQMLHRHFSEFQAPESRERDAAAQAALRDGKELIHYERLIQITGTAHDITEQKAYEQELAFQAEHDSLTRLYNRHYFQRELEREVHRLAFQAEHDSLTRLYNRHYFQRELEREVHRASRGHSRFALLYLDLDQFKYVNDTQGHAAGDRLLIECADLLRQHLREGDLLARFGGDEFTLLLFDVDEHGAVRVAEYIRQLFENYRFLDEGRSFNVTVSIGINLVDDETVNADEALARADLACNIAKSQGRNRLHLFDPADRRKDGMAEDMGWAARVRDAFEQDRFRLAYQPIIAIDSGQIHDYEVLLRMTLDDGDVILPGGFMPAAERFGLIHQVDRWTVRHAMHTLSDLRAEDSSVRFAINLSGRAFEDEGLLPLIHGILVETGLEPSALTFEITESAAISNLAAATAFIHRLKDMGCQFALDDFGTGFSSFAYLKHLPVDKLKIDGSFVRGMAETRVDQAMVQSMNEIAHALGKQTIAEFVENAATLKLLRRYGVDYAQGHFLSRPLTHISRFPENPRQGTRVN